MHKSYFIGKNISYNYGIRMMKLSTKRVLMRCKTKEGEVLFGSYLGVITFTNFFGLYCILFSNKEKNKKAVLNKVKRGGNVAIHNYGNLVCYPILKIKQFVSMNKGILVNIGYYIRNLEKKILNFTEKIGLIYADTIIEYTGIWINKGDISQKIIAIGISLKNMITNFGLSLNLGFNAKKIFFNIIPCGLFTKGLSYICKYLKVKSYSLRMRKISYILYMYIQKIYLIN